MTDPMAQPTLVLVGTASWQEPDFIEHWYPKGLSKTKLLPYYAEHFSFVEVNGTFYGIPQAKSTEQWCRQTPGNFSFSVKLHKLLSRHATDAKFLPADVRSKADIIGGKVDLSAKMEKLVARKFIAGIQPLFDAGKLGALLLQLSPSFQPRTHVLSELDNVLELFAGFPVAVELRNRNWLEGEQAGATVQFFRKRQVTFVSVDAPPGSKHFTVMPSLDLVTNPALAYFRLHGRNEDAYVKGRTVQDRFNYDYSVEELATFAQRVTGIADQVRAVQVVFNNNRHRFAPDAAARFIKILIAKAKNLKVITPQQLL
jgi:uncharacterized protein YecE (DUF72 family)